MKGSMDRVQRGGPWTGSKGVVHGPGVLVLYTSTHKVICYIMLESLLGNEMLYNN